MHSLFINRLSDEKLFREDIGIWTADCFNKLLEKNPTESEINEFSREHVAKLTEKKEKILMEASIVGSETNTTFYWHIVQGLVVDAFVFFYFLNF